MYAIGHKPILSDQRTCFHIHLPLATPLISSISLAYLDTESMTGIIAANLVNLPVYNEEAPPAVNWAKTENTMMLYLHLLFFN